MLETQLHMHVPWCLRKILKHVVIKLKIRPMTMVVEFLFC